MLTKPCLLTVLLFASAALASASQQPSNDNYTYQEQKLRERLIAIDAERYSNMTPEERTREFEKLDAKIRAEREKLTWRAPVRSEFQSIETLEKPIKQLLSLTPPPTALAPDANRPESFLTPAVIQPDSLPSENPYQRLLRLDPLLASKTPVKSPTPFASPVPPVHLNAAQDPKKMEYWQAISTQGIAERYGISDEERKKRQRLLDKQTYESPHVPDFPIGSDKKYFDLREKELIKSERAKDKYRDY